jgi:hypothetical protein
MAIRKNKKFIDPRYFMDEKTDILKEEKKEKYPGLSPYDDRGAHDHRHRDADGKPVGKNIDVFGRTVKDDDESENATNEGAQLEGGPEVDIQDAIQMLEAEEDTTGTLSHVINRLYEALEKLKPDEEPQDKPYDPMTSPFTRPKAARYR